ncbi:MAG TPA: MFS transporter, partial [Clostridia bacterium]|nr:MFS transporter [Clostridia bacterium]
LFWTLNRLFVDKLGASKNFGFFFSVAVFCVFGTALMLQGFFNTKERVKGDAKQKNLLSNLAFIVKAKPLLLNLIAGALYSIMTVGTAALTTYFIKWNVKEIFAGWESNRIMSVFTPAINILPAVASVIGLLVAPFLIKKFEKKDLLIYTSIFGGVVNIASYFVGYYNLWLFIVLRFFAYLPTGIWSSITTMMIGDCVDYIEYTTGKRVEGTCFSLLTFMGKFQNSINVALTGVILDIVGYNGALDPDVVNQSPLALKGIFFMVTMLAGIGGLIAMIPYFFYKLDNETCKVMAEENLRRRLDAGEEAKAEAC